MKRQEKRLGDCRLCGTRDSLCQSHIVPEFCYSRLYDKDMRAARLASRGRSDSKIVQKGIWSYLLCESCETKLNTGCEAYFYQAWYKEGRLPSLAKPGPGEITGLKYEPFRLFHLSVLWRASLSNHPMFRDVNLGETRENQIRQIIESQNGMALDGAFAFTCDLLTQDGRPLEFVSDAQKIFYNPAVAVFHFMYAGCIWKFYISSFTPPEIGDRVLRKDGTLPIVTTDFRDYFGIEKPRRGARISKHKK